MSSILGRPGCFILESSFFAARVEVLFPSNEITERAEGLVA
jgi:hypothetical protein